MSIIDDLRKKVLYKEVEKPMELSSVVALVRLSDIEDILSRKNINAELLPDGQIAEVKYVLYRAAQPVAITDDRAVIARWQTLGRLYGYGRFIVGERDEAILAGEFS